MRKSVVNIKLSQSVGALLDKIYLLERHGLGLLALGQQVGEQGEGLIVGGELGTALSH